MQGGCVCVLCVIRVYVMYVVCVMSMLCEVGMCVFVRGRMGCVLHVALPRVCADGECVCVCESSALSM